MPGRHQQQHADPHMQVTSEEMLLMMACFIASCITDAHTEVDFCHSNKRIGSTKPLELIQIRLCDVIQIRTAACMGC